MSNQGHYLPAMLLCDLLVCWRRNLFAAFQLDRLRGRLGEHHLGKIR